ncbi:TetR/AcrR family transcriptional regulator [Streptomyces albus]|uniref:TetR/AcrR family transcriptional regulator n=1 Tax=Streptomyces sp. PHES57 TaxID=2872626 RepID=UPI001CEC0C24|nr:TetR/AcrR family transcriptional regulator [Streptomyces sp. PHES57]
MPKSSEQPQRRPGRPATLSRTAVTDAAERLLDEEGLSALTVRRVARELGTSPMSLYRHVADKQELLALVLDRLAARLPRPPLPTHPRERLTLLWGLIHDGLAAHAWTVEVLSRGVLIGPSVLWHVEAILQALCDAGLPPERAADCYLATWHYTVGRLGVRGATARSAARHSAGTQPYALRVLSEVDPERMPVLASLSGHWERARQRDDYPEGLERLLDGWLAGG